ncbi:MAG TPA: glycine cleavage system aminomethyltransferase GcvT [Rhodothermia bacterium]|nr:glycine cleavage system aminomethyltransferase GcvT [Rhodothermia bacterium]
MSLLRTSLYDLHVRLGARMTGFGGFEMPVQYTSITEEHLAVRNAAGMFDVSHMGEFLVTGPKASSFVQRLVSNDVEQLYDGRVMYSVMCNESGGIVDDLLVYRLEEDRYMLVVNAANIEKDWRWVVSHNVSGAELKDVSSEVALIAVQGPAAVDIVQSLTTVDLSDLKYYHFVRAAAADPLGGDLAFISHTGYTGERGFELYCSAESAPAVWQSVMDAGRAAGLRPAGLGARDTLRLEAGYCLYGNDIDDGTNPFEAGLGWVTKLDKGPFVGSEALREVKLSGSSRRLVAFVMQERGIPRKGYPLHNADGETIGEVTSGSQSPVLGAGIGMGYVVNDEAYRAPGSTIYVEIRGNGLAAEVRKPPLHKS